MKCAMNTENRWLVMVSYGFNTSKLLQNSGTRLPQLMNTSSFHQNVVKGTGCRLQCPQTLFSAKRLVKGLATTKPSNWKQHSLSAVLLLQ